MPTPISCPTPSTDARTRAAWQTQVAAAKQTSGLCPLLIRHRHDLLPRFAVAYQQLRALPKRVRRRLQWYWHASLGGLALLLTLGQAPALAVTINVDGTVCTLVDAITAANTNALVGGCDGSASTGADTLVLQPSSVHTLTTVNNNTTIYGPTGLPVVSSEITMEGNSSTITRSSGAPGFRILAVSHTGIVTLKDTTISGGSAVTSGGGIFNYEGTVTLDGCTVSGNTAEGSGGGVANFSGAGADTLILTNSTLSGNSARYSGGGVFSIAFNLGASAVLLFTNSTFTANLAQSGGGVFIKGVSTVTVTKSTLSGNSALGGGGGVYNGALSYAASTVTLTNSTFSGNSAFNGGGVFNKTFSYGGNTVSLTNSTLSGNTAAGKGGGVYDYTASHGVSTVTLTNSTLSANEADSGGGVFNSAYGTEASKVLTLTNSTLSGNTARDYGGGVFSSVSGTGASNVLTLTNSTLSGNTADSGGGVFHIVYGTGTSTATLAHSVVSGNTAAIGAEVVNYYGTANANAYNLLGHNGLTNAQAFVHFTPGGYALTATSDGNTPTALSAILNPTLANNGGPTKTHNLVAGSPAIDAFFSACPATDQRGFLRPVDGDGDSLALCDIGAVEFGADPCAGAVPTTGCTVNGMPDQLCQGTNGDDTILGTPRDDIIVGKGSNDILKGKGGNDLLCGGSGNDTLDGGSGNDTLVGGAGEDILRGKGGEDLLLGGKGNDQLSGGARNDILEGRGGNDSLNGGPGTDLLKGGPGTDSCVNGEPPLSGCES